MDITAHISATLRRLRQTREISLTQAAELTGVSKAMLGQIERGESSPTVATLWKIATGFNVPFSLFIAVADKPASAGYDPQQSQMVIAPLFPWDEKLAFDWLSVTLAPGARSESAPHKTGVVEHVVVVSGALDIQTEGQWQTLTAGQGLRFAGDRPHAYHNSQCGHTHFYSLIHYPARY